MSLVKAIWQTFCFLWCAFWVFCTFQAGHGSQDGMVDGWWLWMLGFALAPAILTWWVARSASKFEK